MKYTFGNSVDYLALDGKTYPAVVLGPHNVPQESDYDIVYLLCNNEVVRTFCWEERLSYRRDPTLDLLEKERQRAMSIVYDAMEKHNERSEMAKVNGNRMWFIDKEISEELRIIGNAISGGDASSITLGETMRERVEKEYWSHASSHQP